KLRRRAPRCPIIVYTGAKQWEWEEEAYFHGATHVLTKPVRIRMLTTLLDRFWTAAPSGEPAAPQENSHEPKFPEPSRPEPRQSAYQSLGALRGFSAILTHSLDSEAMLKQFLLLLRELVGINRAAIFLHQPVHWLSERLPAEESRRLRAACAIGL